jgi:hypothetical protein
VRRFDLPAMQAPRTVSDTEAMLSQASQLPQGFELFCRAGLAHDAVLFETPHLALAATLDQQTG